MGFSINKEYPGRFLRGSDMSGLKVDLVIKNVKREKVFSMKDKKDIPKLVIYFEGKDKGVCLGKQRAMDLRDLFGDDTDKWIGKSIKMYAEEKDIFGKKVNVIRFKESDEPVTKEEKKALSKELDSIS